MKAIINTDLVKSIVDNNHVGEVIFDSITLDELVIDTERIWWPCYKGHTWSDASYKWADDFSTCTASRHCTIDNCTHSETLEGKVVSTTTPPTCTSKGVIHHTAIFETSQGSDWVLTDQFEVETIPAIGHAWSDTTYEWADDYLTCIATRVCSNDSSHTETATATITNAVKTAATCTTNGIMTYTAAFTESWAETQTKTEPIPATGHAYEGVLEKPTCTTDGCTTHTCAYCGDFYKVTEPALGHTEVVDEAVDPTCTETGLTEGKHCSVCHEVLVAQTVVAANGHAESEWIIVTEPTVTGLGYMHKICTVCGKELDAEAIPALGNVEYVLSSDGAYYSAKAYNTDIEGEVKISAYHKGLPVTKIENNAFKDCLNITSVVIGGKVTTIGHSAFSGCSSLTSVVIGDSVTSIGSYAFADCTHLTSVVIPDSVTSLGGDAFRECSRLTSVVIGDSVTEIGSWAFYYCNVLTSVTISGSVTSIGMSAFARCEGLTNVYINDLSNWCNIEFGDDDANPLYYANNLYVNGELVTELAIPDDVKKINNYAFYGYYSLTSVTISDSVNSIGDHAFQSCVNLKNIYFGANSQLESIGKEAFYLAYISSVTIPDSVIHIGVRALSVALLFSSLEAIILNNTACWELSNPDDESSGYIYINVNDYTTQELGSKFVDEQYSDYEWNAREHAYGEWYVTDEPTCISTGTKRSECSKCGYHQTLDIPATGVHDYKLSVTPPTCTKMGYTTYMCTHCSHSYVDIDSSVEAKGHSPSDWIIDIEPTLAAEGSKHKECNHCGEILETGTIPKLDNSTYLVTESGEFLTDEQGNLLIL